MELPTTLRRVVDPRTGIATRIWEVAADPLIPDLFVAVAESSSAAYYIDNAPTRWGNSSPGSGAAFTREQALWATVGETVERYSACIYDRRGMFDGTASELPGPSIDMDKVIAYSGSQYQETGFPFAKFNPSTTRSWTQGRSLLSGDDVYAPSQMVFMSSEWESEQRLLPSVSTGLAAHAERDTAILSGLLELIERDAFSSAWLLSHHPPRLLVDGDFVKRLSPPCRTALQNTALRLSLFALPNEFGVATIVAVAEHQELGFGVFGAATRLTLADAVEKAVIEALHGWAGAVIARRKGEPIPAADQVAAPHQHALHHMDEVNWRKTSHFRSSSRTISVREIDAVCQHDRSSSLVLALERADIPSYVFDVTSPDVRAIGFNVVRCLAPGLHPLSFGRTPLPGDVRRLRKNATTWGIEYPGSLNPLPHPFP